MRRLALCLLLLPAACGGGNDAHEPIEVSTNSAAPVDQSAENRRRATELQVRAKARMDEGDYSGAAELAEQAVKLAPDEPLAHEQLGYAYEKLLRYEDALSHYTRAIEMFDGKLRSRASVRAAWCSYRLARAAFDKGDSAAALTHMDRAIELNGSEPENYNLKGTIQYKREEYAPAAESFGLMADIAAGEKVYEALSWKGKSQYMASDWQAARKTFTKIINDGVEGYEAYGWRAFCSVNMGWNDDAETDFRQALDRTADPVKKAEYENALKAIAEAE